MMRTPEEIKRMQVDLDFLIAMETDPTSAKILSAASLAIHWVMRTELGDQLPNLIDAKDIRHRQALLN